jgi:hypothetical protein
MLTIPNPCCVFLSFVTHVEDNLMDGKKLFDLWKVKRLVLVHMGDYLPKYLGTILHNIYNI